MKLVLGSLVTVVLAVSLFSFLSQVDAGCGNMTGDCNSDSISANNDDNAKSDDKHDKSETNPKANDPCDYNGLDVCDKSKNGCDSESFDCLTDLGNGNYCTTGMCPGDDKANKNKNKNNDNKDSNSNSDSNSDSNPNIKKFIVKVILDDTADSEAQQFQMRVFVYGPHTLNKPTLDKPGQIVDIGSCGSSCHTEWVFTAYKVPIGSKIKACVWNQESGHQNCGYGQSHSNYGPETIHILLPSQVSAGVKQDYAEPIPNKNPITVTPNINSARFLWGAATSAYQVEGGISNNDWEFFTTTPAIKDRVNKLTSNSFFYKGSPIVLQPAGEAVREWNLDYYQKDIDRAKPIGLNALRIGIEWARVEPQNNQWNLDAIQHYKQMITIMREKGITPIITLNHFTLPIWILRPPTQFTKAVGQNFLPSPLNDIPLSEPPPTDGYWKSLRGWENPATVQEFDEFVRKIVPEFKDQVDYWITLNEPVGSYIGLGYLAGLWPPGFFLDGLRAEKVLHNLIQAHVDAYNIISSVDNVDADNDGTAKSVGFSHAMTFVKPAKSTTVLVDNTEAAKNFDYFTNDYFLNAVVNGEEDLNYVKTLQRYNTNSRDFIVHENWKDKIDFIGVNYYRAMYVKFDPILALSSARFIGGVPLNDLRLESQPHGKLNDLGWEMYPQGLYSLMVHIKDQWNKPVLITENGIPDKSGNLRAPYIISHLQQVKKAIDSGVKVIGYIYWSLTDNYEWQAAYSPDARFGLYHIDRNSNGLERTVTEGAKALQYIIRGSNGGVVTDSTLSKAGGIYGTFTSDGTKVIHYVNGGDNGNKKPGRQSVSPKPAPLPPPQSSEPSVSVGPSCGPGHPGFTITVNANGFKPDSTVTWKLVASNNQIPMYGFFQTNVRGGFSDATFLEDLENDHYKIYFGDDANSDSKFDRNGATASADLTIPCP